MSSDAREQEPVARAPADTPRVAASTAASNPSVQAAGQVAVDRIKDAQQLTSSMGASATVDKNEELLHDDKGHRVTIASGTTVSFDLDEGGLLIQVKPGLIVEGPGEKLHVDTVRYDFATASFTTHASARFDVFGVYAKLAQRKLNHVLDVALKPLLPAKVQQAGYDPKTDPDLAATLKGVAAHLPSGGGSGLPGGTLSHAEIHNSILVNEEVRIPLGLDGVELYIKPQTSISLQLKTTGDVLHPKLEQASLSSLEGIILRKGAGSLQQLRIKEVDIAPGGRFNFDYDLLPEHLVGLFQLFGAAAQSHSEVELAVRTREVHAARLDAVRKDVDAKLQATVPARFRELLAQYDHIVPGLSLLDLFS
jgi:hypothetical protein